MAAPTSMLMFLFSYQHHQYPTCPRGKAVDKTEIPLLLREEHEREMAGGYGSGGSLPYSRSWSIAGSDVRRLCSGVVGCVMRVCVRARFGARAASEQGADERVGRTCVGVEASD